MSAKYRDYYQILGLKPDASDDQIRKAYRKQARQYHPDVSKDPDAENKFKAASEAYEVLRDPEKRRKYDQLGHNWQPGEDFRPPPGFQAGTFSFGNGSENFHTFTGDFSDFFETLFGGSRAGFSSERAFRQPFGPEASKGGDAEAQIEVSLQEALHGASRNFQLERPVATPEGIRLERHTVEVTIPAGVTAGSRIRLAGQGQGGHAGGEPGDLYLIVTLRPDPTFTVDGHDLHCTLDISAWDAALGAKVTVPTLEGKANVDIPGGTSSGRTLRLRGQGLPKHRGQRGDLLVTLRIVVPTRLSARQKELFEALRAAAQPQRKPSHEP